MFFVFTQCVVGYMVCLLQGRTALKHLLKNSPFTTTILISLPDGTPDGVPHVNQINSGF